uniref:IS1 family transposase n=1 Tax=Scandinavium goeteborgense TaxID=1851514 RepID=UPI00358E9EC2
MPTFCGLLIACNDVHCPRCDFALVYRHSYNPKANSRFHYRECRFVFQMSYTYSGQKTGVNE